MNIKFLNMILLFAFSLLFSFCASDASNADNNASSNAVKKEKPAEVVNVSEKTEPIKVKAVEKNEATAASINSDVVKISAEPIKVEPVKMKTAQTSKSAQLVKNENEKIEMENTVVETEEKPTLNKPNHTLWNALLQKHVSSDGKVNYKGIKAEKAKLAAYINELDANPIESSWSPGEKMAYWINVYNAFTIKLIVDNYPVNYMFS